VQMCVAPIKVKDPCLSLLSQGSLQCSCLLALVTPHYVQSIEEHSECAFEPFKGVGFICSLFLSVRPFPSIQGFVAA